MTKRAIITEIFIWIIILVITFLGITFVYFEFFVKPNIYNIKFKDIDGITKGSPVRFMGISIGYVRELKPKDKNINVQIIVTKKNIKIPNGAVARVEFYGLGGSKSIELMPPDGTEEAGIVTENTIRIADVVKETEGIVSIIELIDHYLKDVNSIEAQKNLEQLKEINSNKIIQTGEDFAKTEKEITDKIESIKTKQKGTTNSIKKAADIFDNLNKFIKKQ